jgi:hypothetical protein
VEHDLGGGTLLPGFVDAHNHFLATGEGLAALDLHYPDIASTDAVLAVVAAAAGEAARGDPLVGVGLDPGKYPYPTRDTLDRLVPANPLYLHHISGHGVVVNGAALTAAGVDDTEPDPAGGHFGRDEQGRLDGLCMDAAMGLVVPTDVEIGTHGPNFHTRVTDEALVRAVDRAGTAFLAAGITTVCDAQVTSRELRGYLAARDARLLHLRTVCMPLSNQLEAYGATGLVGPFGDDRLSIGHLKVYADGTLTGGTAAFSDELGVIGQTGSYFHEPAALVDLLVRAWTDGWRIGVHAQGDEAIAAVLDGFERGAVGSPRHDARPRIEHAGYPRPAGIERMRRLGVIPVNQPSYLYDFGDEYAASLGDHVHDLQPWRDELDAGLRVVISSDSDVTSYRPLDTVAHAMARTTRGGTVLGKRHRLSLDEALLAHTIDAAFAVGLEASVGSFEPGKLADLTIVEGDIRTMEPTQIREAAVRETIVASDPIEAGVDRRGTNG